MSNPLLLLYAIFDRKGTPFVYLLLTSECENSELEGSKKTFHFNIDRFCFCSVPLVCLIQSVLLVLTPMMIP